MKILCIIFLLLSTGLVQAQRKELSEEKKKEFEAQKVAFITRELQFTPEEAAAFWPIYNEMRNKISVEEKKMRQLCDNARPEKTVSEEAYVSAIQDMLLIEQRMQNIKKEYFTKILATKKVPASKVWYLPRAERNFHRSLFDKIKKDPHD